VFFDLRKAFDSVPHRPLLEKLEETGLNRHLLQWIANYLCGCYQYAVVDRESSPTTKVLLGVPQGSVLGPLLFLIYTNSLSSLLLTSGSSLVLCADDILLYKPVTCQANYAQLQLDIDAIQLCVNRCHLMLNSSKCKFLCTTRRRAPCFPPELLLLGSELLEQVDSYCYLGVKISCKLTWTDYIEQVSTKERRWLARHTDSFIPGQTQQHY